MKLSILEIQKEFPSLSFQDLIKILEFVKKSSKEKLLATRKISISTQDIKKITSITERIKNNEPIDYIFGYKYFYYHKFIVSQDVLIPRPETELLVDHAVKLISNQKQESINILEVGTGSGCISISILTALNMQNQELNNKTVTIHATDISTKALKVATKNAISLLDETTRHSLKLIEADILPKGTKTKFDVIISNPPYIPSHLIKQLDKSVRNYEPRTALDGGQNGIDFYRTIIERTKANQRANTIFLFEVDEASLTALKTYLDSQNSKYKVYNDFRNHPRIMRIYF